MECHFIPNIVASSYCKLCVMCIFFVFARFLCFKFFFLCLGLDSYVFASEFLLGLDVVYHSWCWCVMHYECDDNDSLLQEIMVFQNVQLD
jgi:hypothetical protein